LTHNLWVCIEGQFGFRKRFTCIRIKAMASPAGARLPHCAGNIVARTTIIAVIQGRLPPWKPKCLVTSAAALHIMKDKATAVAL